MSNGLLGITGWPTRAANAHWCITTLARDCHVSLSTLERHFREAMGQCPHDWLNDERMRRARELLERRERIKDIANLLGYGHSQNLSAAFTNYHGYPPSYHLKKSREAKAESQVPKSEIGNRKSEIGNRNSVAIKLRRQDNS